MKYLICFVIGGWVGAAIAAANDETAPLGLLFGLCFVILSVSVLGYVLFNGVKAVW